MDYPIILWDVDTLDWAHTPAAQITSYVLENTKGGNIILMHDYQSGGCETMQALKMFIPELLSRGFSFVTVSELLGSQ
jgi:peptidoglycan/xylan/chitin deacetylase (PgdA/CDA1 family)